MPAGLEVFETDARARVSVGGASGGGTVSASKIGRIKVISGTNITVTVYNWPTVLIGKEVWSKAAVNAGDEFDLQCPHGDLPIANGIFRVNVDANGPAEIDVTYSARGK